MRRHLVRVVLVVLAMASPFEAGAQRLGVFVTRVDAPMPARPTEAERQQASAAYDAANAARKALEKTLKAQYGNRRDKWPAEAQEQLADAEEARYRVNADWQYRRDAEPVTEDWRAAVALALTQSGNTGPKEHITPASSADQAHLIVTITGVRNPSAAINAADDRCVAVRLERGPKVSAAQFASVPRTYRPSRAKVARLEGPDDTSPVWLFEGCALHPYFTAEEAVACLVNDFVGANRDPLTGAARP
jgi:hypothetical protein